MKTMKLLQKKVWSYSLFKDQKTEFEIEKITLTDGKDTFSTTNSELKISEITVPKTAIEGKDLVLNVKFKNISEKIQEHKEMFDLITTFDVEYIDVNGNVFEWSLRKMQFQRTEFGKRVLEFADKYNISSLSARKIIDDYNL